jgi:hypothetical protein
LAGLATLRVTEDAARSSLYPPSLKVAEAFAELE